MITKGEEGEEEKGGQAVVLAASAPGGFRDAEVDLVPLPRMRQTNSRNPVGGVGAGVEVDAPDAPPPLVDYGVGRRALGIFAEGIFAEGIFAERNFRRTEISPNGNFAVRKFRRTEFSPLEFSPNGILAEKFPKFESICSM